jgi:hypothetical protein
MRLIKFFLFLILFNSSALGVDSGPENNDMVFVLETSMGVERIPFYSGFLSSVLKTVFDAAKDKESLGPQGPEIYLKIHDRGAFLKVLEYLSTDKLKDYSWHLIAILDHAHEFAIDRLGHNIADEINNTNFSLLDNVFEIDWILELAVKILEISSGKKRLNQVYWQEIIFEGFIKYIIIQDMIGDERQLKERLIRNLPQHKKLIDAITKPHPGLVKQCQAAVKDIKENRAQEIQKGVKKDAKEWAQKIAQEKIGPALVELFKQNQNSALEIDIDEKSASTYALALSDELTEDYEVLLSPDIGSFEMPGQYPIEWEDCHGCFWFPRLSCTVQENTPFGMCLAGTIGCILPCLGLQCLQAATCGWFYCCGQDCKSGRSCLDLSANSVFDDRTSRTIYFGAYKGPSMIPNCLKGQCGPMRTIRIRLK